MTGSHCDAIPHAGMYDGTLGVLGGIAAIKGLQHAGFKPHKSIEVLFFTSEEPTRFGLGCIGRCALRSSSCVFLHLRVYGGRSSKYDISCQTVYAVAVYMASAPQLVMACRCTV